MEQPTFAPLRLPADGRQDIQPTGGTVAGTHGAGAVVFGSQVVRAALLWNDVGPVAGGAAAGNGTQCAHLAQQSAQGSRGHGGRVGRRASAVCGERPERRTDELAAGAEAAVGGGARWRLRARCPTRTS